MKKKNLNIGSAGDFARELTESLKALERLDPLEDLERCMEQQNKKLQSGQIGRGTAKGALSLLQGLDSSGPMSDSLRKVLRQVNPKTGKVFGEEVLKSCEHYASQNTAQAKRIAALIPRLRQFLAQR